MKASVAGTTVLGSESRRANLVLAALAVVLLVATTAIGAVPAGAHGEVLGASPTPNGEFGAPFDTVEIQFDETFAFPEMVVTTPDGREITGLFTSPQVGRLKMTLPETETGIGRYVVEWEVQSVDGDRADGVFVFALVDGGPSIQGLPADLVGVPAFRGEIQEDEPRPVWVLVLFGVTIALGLMTIWIFFDWLADRIRSRNVTETSETADDADARDRDGSDADARDRDGRDGAGSDQAAGAES